MVQRLKLMRRFFGHWHQTWETAQALRQHQEKIEDLSATVCTRKAFVHWRFCKLLEIFKSDWFYAGGKEYTTPKSPSVEQEGGCRVQVIASGPDSMYQGIMHEYFTIITDAQDYVYLITPYFVPGESIMTALKTSALSGIDIQIMIPYDSDSRWMKWCMFTYLEELLESGVRIFLFHDGFLHGKVILSDDIVSSIGTANVDDRSFEANFEVNALVYDLKTALKLKAQFAQDKNFCEELTSANFNDRGDRNKIMEPIARLTSSML